MTGFLKVIACVGIFALVSACEVEKTQEGEMPDVDVSAEAGEMAEYDVDTADVDVETVEKTVDVPVVDVEMPDEEPETE